MNYVLGSVAAGLTAVAAGVYAADALVDQSSYGGHDEDFVYDVDHHLVCMVCTKPFREPHRTSCCQQNFCESCLKVWTRKNGKSCCPHCRAEGRRFLYSLNHSLKNEVERLDVRCTHHRKGCRWVGELRELKRHLSSDSGCDYVEVECPNRCKRSWLQRLWPGEVNAEIYRKDLRAHLSHECVLRPYRCEHCHLCDTYREITETHYSQCPEFPLTCPNLCGASGIKRKNIKSHRARCPLEPMECPFAEAGCDDDLHRREFDGHMTSKQQDHLLLVMRQYKEMKQRLEKVEKELQETKKQLKAVRR